MNTEIQAKLSSLANAVGATSGFWRGETQRTFATLMERWNSDAAKLTDALTSISQAMSQTGASYTATEDTSTSTLRSSGSGLNL